MTLPVSRAACNQNRKPVSNPAAALIRGTLAHRGISQAAAAEAMAISKAGLSDVIRQRKGVSAQYCIGIPGDLLIRLHAQFDFQKAHHARRGALRKVVRVIA